MKTNLKFCCISDLHLTVKTPLCRRDNFIETQFRKLDFIFKTTEKENGLLFMAGDIFDRPNEPYSLVSQFIELKNKYKIKVFVIAGQHDMHFHNPDLSNTPLGVLIKSGVVHFLEKSEIQGKTFYGCSFGQEYQKADILITHEMVVKNKPLFSGQSNFKFAEEILRKNPYEIVISGDNHQKFTMRYQKKILINCGSVTRSKSNQQNHVPAMFVVNGKEIKEIKEIKIPIKKDVFKTNIIDTLDIPDISIDVKEQIIELTNKMQQNNTKTLKFKEVTDAVLEKYKFKKIDERDKIEEKIKYYFK